MNNRIKEAFKNKAFIGFLTAGDPDIETSERYILKMVEAGADLIEIGIPFSDPIAEGEVIQAATLRALKSGATVSKVLSMVESIRLKTQVPIVFLTYLNPIFNCGYENFFSRCQKAGVDGVIIPDLPFEEKNEVESVADKYGVDLIPLIAPTSGDRTEKIATAARGYAYILSTTGALCTEKESVANLKSLVNKVKKCTNTPCVIGFGTSGESEAKEILEFCDGITVGSAIVRIVAQYGKNADTKIYEYVKSMKNIFIN